MDAMQRALAQHACAETAVRFFHHLDRREYEQVSAQMASDGVWVRQGTPLAAGDAMVQTLRARPERLTTRHLLSNLVVDVQDESTARVLYEVSVFMRDGDGPPRHATILTGEDRLVREGTAWRIQLKKAQVLFNFGG